MLRRLNVEINYCQLEIQAFSRNIKLQISHYYIIKSRDLCRSFNNKEKGKEGKLQK